MSNTPVTFTGTDAAQRYNAACKALRCQGYTRVSHYAAADGCFSVWSQASGETQELLVTVPTDAPLVTGFARMGATA